MWGCLVTQWHRFELAKNVVVTVDPSQRRSFPPEEEQRIQEIWTRRKSSKLLFEASMICLVHHTPDLLIGQLVNFSAWYACTVDRALQEKLAFYPLGVTGRTIWKNRVLVGRRGPDVLSYSGAMECCPSGSLDPSFLAKDGKCDLVQAILSELTEETGIAAAYVQSVTPVALYQSTDDGVFDIQCDITLDPSADMSSLITPSKEYDQLLWMTKEEAKTIFADRPWVPLSRHLLGESLL